ncbi:MAG: hypothetical protein NPMRIOTA_320009 [Nitrosopumilales archaeon]|nr:MAG: hypothetical protein NPMRIOTA_320009 [Nitrosopumilales archaeon]
MTIAIYLAHLNPVTKSHVEIIEELKKENQIRVMPVIFMKEEKEINTRGFPFNFEIRKEMIQSVFGDSIMVLSNYTFYAPFVKYLPPLFSSYSWKLKKQVLDGISDDYFTYTGSKSEGLILRLYGLHPKVGKRKEISASFVRNKMYEAARGSDTDWEKYVPSGVSKIIKKNWDVIKKYCDAEDQIHKVSGMKFPDDGFQK